MGKVTSMLTAELELGFAASAVGLDVYVSRHWMSWCEVAVRHPLLARDAGTAHEMARALPHFELHETLRNHVTGCSTDIATTFEFDVLPDARSITIVEVAIPSLLDRGEAARRDASARLRAIVQATFA